MEEELRKAFEDQPVPSHLWPRIRRSLRDAAPGAVASVPDLRRRSPRLPTYAALAAMLVAVVVGTVLWRGGSPTSVSPAQLAMVPIDEFRTFVDSNRPLDVATTDPHGVRTWFRGKLGVSVPTPATRISGAGLVGGRLCYILQRRVASIMYTVDGRPMSLYVMADDGLTLPASEPAGDGVRVVRDDGYTNALWSQAGLVYALVSQLPREDAAAMARGVLSAL